MAGKINFKNFYELTNSTDRKHLIKDDMKSASKDWRVEDIKFILNTLSCPDSCNAFCCKNTEVGMLFGDVVNIIDNGDDDIKKKAMDMNVFVRGAYHNIYTKSPCEFLNEGGKCSVHDYKPLTCSIYPFAYVEEKHGVELVFVLGCSLGFDFYNTYKDIIHAEFEKYIRSKNNDEETILAEKENFKLMCEAWLNDKSDIPKVGCNNPLYFPSAILTSIAHRLGKTSNYHATKQKSKMKKGDGNKPCPCGSGKKYKKCCMSKSE